jgi:hypothetical protein
MCISTAATKLRNRHCHTQGIEWIEIASSSSSEALHKHPTITRIQITRTIVVVAAAAAHSNSYRGKTLPTHSDRAIEQFV